MPNSLAPPERVETARAQVMGVGCEGALVRIAKVKRAGE